MEESFNLQNFYEDFYDMAARSEVFAEYCKAVFGMDFSQDGFSDIDQINDIIRLTGIKQGDQVLDIGCGNGKMAEYIADKTGAAVYGFDYSKNAIESALLRTKGKDSLHYEVGAIGGKQYPSDKFDVIISVDTMYFAPDLTAFVGQIRDWLKPDGIFITYYGEGPVYKISADADSTELALALKENKFPYKALDYTRAHFDLLKRKRRAALDMKENFINSNQEFYNTYIINQSIDLDMDYMEFIKSFNKNL
jgi:SAM-dependent methyltransferase